MIASRRFASLLFLSTTFPANNPPKIDPVASVKISASSIFNGSRFLLSILKIAQSFIGVCFIFFKENPCLLLIKANAIPVPNVEPIIDIALTVLDGSCPLKTGVINCSEDLNCPNLYGVLKFILSILIGSIYQKQLKKTIAPCAIYIITNLTKLNYCLCYTTCVTIY